MTRPRPSRAACALALVLAGCAAARAEEPTLIEAALPPPTAAEARPELGLMGTIPLYWGEAADIAEVLGGQGTAHWARAPLEQQFSLRPLAALTEDSLAGLDRLLLAQPRGLSPAENVALDNWVRAGGRVLLFADPMLTGETRFGIGDRRRPQDVILLSPILSRWGLELWFDEAQASGTTVREIAGQAVPVNLPGRFEPADGAACSVAGEGLLATCTIGSGRVVVFADAALLDLHEPAPQAAPALAMLIGRVFGPAREIAGHGGGSDPAEGESATEEVRQSGQNPP